jgi:hypothetical protein
MPTVWPAKILLKLFFLAAQTDTAAIDDDDDFIVEGIIDIAQSLRKELMAGLQPDGIQANIVVRHRATPETLHLIRRSSPFFEILAV